MMLAWSATLPNAMCATVVLAGLASASLAQVAVPAERQAAHIAVIAVHGPIDDITVNSIERRVAEASRDGANAIVLELNTPGGDMYATLQLCHLIKTQFPANTVAWVRPQAYSAGAIIALASREIVMADGAAMGDAAPIQAIPGMGITPLPATERAKLEAPIISEVLDSARKRGYDENLVQAFVRIGSELWLLRNESTLKRAIVDREEYFAHFGEEPPRQALAVVPDSATLADSEIEPVIPLLGGLGERDVLESPNGIPQGRSRLDSSQRGQWKLVGQIAKADQLLVVRTDEALALRLARAQVSDERELSAWFGATTLTRYAETWSEDAVRFLVSWPVRIALIAILIVGFVVEALTPGGIIFGAAATVALLLLVGAPALLGLAQWWELVAIILGLALVALDIVVIPVGGWLAITGGALVLGALVSSFVTRDISSAEGQRQLLLGIGSTLAGLFGSVAATWMLWKYLPETRFARPATLQAVASSQPGPGEVPTRRRETLPVAGTIVRAATDLRPSGKVLAAGRPWNARTSGEYVNAGERVRIVRSSAAELEVEPAPESDGAAPESPTTQSP
ncbi:MAG: hypothetical protein EXS03_03140 [Phycisphaerales bacterium]|nr:hypothetical protein [Phycisphaerales bacterium]